MKRFLLASALAGLLVGSVTAGDMSTSGSPSPAPDATTQTVRSTLPGEMPTLGSALVSDVALAAVLAAVSLLS